MRREEHAKIGRQPAQRHPLEAALAQIAGEAGRRLAVVLAKGRVGVDRPVEALADDQLGMRDVEIGMERGARSALHAMIRPQGLRAVIELDRLERRLAGMGAGERDVSRRVPVLRDDDMREAPREPVDHRHDRRRHAERPARRRGRNRAADR